MCNVYAIQSFYCLRIYAGACGDIPNSRKSNSVFIYLFLDVK